MDLAPSSTRGLREMYISFDWEHSPGAMILGPIEYKECIHGLGVAAASFFVFLTSGCLGLQLPIIALQGLNYLYRATAHQISRLESLMMMIKTDKCSRKCQGFFDPAQ